MVIIILTILFSVAVPFFKKKVSHDIDRVSKQLQQHLEFAKSVAINRQSMVTVCGSSDAKSCDHQWSQGYIAFIDNTGEGIKGEGDPLILFQRYERATFNIHWDGFLSKKIIQFSPGFIWGQNGRLSLSDPAGRRQKLILNSVGRIRRESDLN